MEKLFAYGSLQNEDIQKDLFGRILEGTPETLIGYVVKQIQIEEEFGIVNYPIITQTENQENTINGMVYEISTKELLQSDLYEGLHYKRVEVQLQSKQKAWAYSAVI
ncbi:gamma-glutamylcyclotransferase [Flavobacterium sp. SOK18b]|uniref:gamma-glutamylcyclotransferase family protein n=1 Tax=Flavobacterium sp. SOK18b TaxID=797900 RepID=UPI0015F7A35C|nr:gamma-glutamylcyclotransferase family protein [Flavobacterium sp. SOK18b]MBB1194463.1 gamma-glutamylcyclotransferase [Flavobacterium sp. SOK18b]